MWVSESEQRRPVFIPRECNGEWNEVKSEEEVHGGKNCTQNSVSWKAFHHDVIKEF